MNQVMCVRCGEQADAILEAPVGGQLGATIVAKVCPACWQAWESEKILLINHYGLQMADPDDRKKLTQVMKEFLKLA